MTSELDRHEYSPRVMRLVGLSGWILFVVWACVIVTAAVVYPNPYASVWLLALELAFFGPAMNILHGASENYNNVFLFFQAGLQDTILTLVAYPWIVAGYERVAHWPLVGKGLRSVHLSAQSRRDAIEPFGLIGLWAFVFFPFWSTGPLVGCALGHLLGMRVKVVLISVITGHLCSIVMLVWFFDWLASSTKVVSESLLVYLPWIILGILISAAALAKLYGRFCKGRAKEALPDAETPDVVPEPDTALNE